MASIILEMGIAISLVRIIWRFMFLCHKGGVKFGDYRFHTKLECFCGV